VLPNEAPPSLMSCPSRSPPRQGSSLAE
jgi:hypothetical protein